LCEWIRARGNGGRRALGKGRRRWVCGSAARDVTTMITQTTIGKTTLRLVTGDIADQAAVRQGE